jgi:hypothetical protein
VAPVMLNNPVNGAGMPPKVSQGEVSDESSARSSDRALPALTGEELPPSM